MNNLDFSAEPLFSWYVVLLALSGVLMLGLGAVAGGLKAGWRIVNVLAGIGFLGYAYYLAFVFEGGTYVLFFKAFFLPVALIAYSVKAIVERGNTKTRTQQPVPPAAAYSPNGQAAPYQPNGQAAPGNPYAQPVPPAQPGAQPQPPQAG
ncbi:hypothetical protein [Kitasatospora aureofaciens]|uniref:hypothetical protein n=1 Tax=Kitasatospora aureofaciens TaxID=1894 RepID=UPI001C48970A|nr:hypothetical protein [Kitasatospora aureofaciens]MBV6696555.1 hypothetical protein [Kitasatospora aureofaciens]